MKHTQLTKLNFMALCCILGLFSKKLINPFANVITDALHIPGGVSTGFSIMFIVIACELVQMKKSGTMMCAVQGVLALALGRVGSMGILMPVGYMVSGIAIDLAYWLSEHLCLSCAERMVLANAAGAFTASLFANLVVFQLPGAALVLYLAVSAFSGIVYGCLGSVLVKRLYPMIHYRRKLS